MAELKGNEGEKEGNPYTIVSTNPQLDEKFLRALEANVSENKDISGFVACLRKKFRQIV